MAFRLGEIAQLVDGRLSGDPQLPISGAATLRDACAGQITLADDPLLAGMLAASEAAAVIVPSGFAAGGIPSIEVDDAHAAFAQVVMRFRPPRDVRGCGVSPAAHVSPTASLADGVVVHPGASIADDVVIGPDCVLHSGVRLLAGCRLGTGVTVFPNAVLYENTVVGSRVTIHAGAVIGAYGFGYRTVEGKHMLSAQLGNVEIQDDVEIGASTTIDRGTYGATVIGEGTKVDNLVMIAHNCRVGRYNLICSQVGIAGSCVTGDYVVLAGQVGLRDHIEIGERAVLGAKAGVMRDVPAGSVFVGIPATAEREQMLKQAAWAKLPELRKEFKRLEKRVAQLEGPGALEAA